MAEEKKPAPNNGMGTIDRAFNKLIGYLSDRIADFVSFLFVLVAIGGFYGYFVVSRFEDIAIYLLIAPLVLAVIAHYNKTFATIVFVILMFFVFLF